MSLIKCKICDFEKKAKNKLLIKMIGIALIAFGFWAWISYLFAGSGAAFIICVSIMGLGTIFLCFTDQIHRYNSTKENCPKCGKKEWDFIKE
ncbi:hypothetical protein MMG00_04960 [Ignatzschineria rhizosphaerae]|uniref:Uncharacterized protein n=1 Tax=Ignatzschineria rhizosphaerae TaxID=2923279 RepID=A0ABY3XB73_9GAMM|nr:hypothetical protein [Ignatzschineria rhizosphaerae]UNM97203.1 hypothetical protein MMG00_04960 [Ignatzschineria rhizosphaerae]